MNDATTRTVTIGFIPRERFAVAAESLATLLDTTAEPYELVVVCPGVPRRYRNEMDAVLARRPADRIIEVDHPLLPARSKNLVLEHATGDYVAFVENDTLYPDGWLAGLVAACEAFPADVAAPLIVEGRHGAEEHYDHLLGRIVPAGDGGRLTIERFRGSRNSLLERTRVDFVEQHCLLYRRSALDAIGPFDEELNTRDEVDVSLALWAAGQTVVVEPAVRVNHVAPTDAPEPDERDFFRARWDERRAESSRRRIQERWNLDRTPGDMGFVRARHHLLSLPEMHDRLADLVRAGGTTVLMENGEWFDGEITAGIDGLVPYVDLDGHYGGFPADDNSSIAELDRQIAAGARQLAIAWPAYWWLDHLPALRDRLRDRPVISDDARLTVYSLVDS